MKKLIFMLMAVFFIFTACQKEQNDLSPSEGGILKVTQSITTNMIAGGGKYDKNGTGKIVGTVTQEIVGQNVEVTYQITEPGWIIDETHLYVGPEDGIPSNVGGNPIPGQFPYTVPSSSDEDHAFFSIAYNSDWGTNYVIAAHAAVSYSAVKALSDVLPETAKMSITAYPGQNTFYEINMTEGGALDGEYNGWCVEITVDIDYPDVVYDVNVYLSNGAIPNGIVDHPENFDLVNWLLNQGYIGEESQDCGGVYNWQDMQMAFWYLLNDGTANEPIEEGSNECRVAELVSLAEENGEGFVPDCLEKFAVILEPINGAQVCIIEWTLGPCQGDETAWAYGYHEGAYVPGIPGMSFTDSPFYGGQRWGWYFYSCSWEN